MYREKQKEKSIVPQTKNQEKPVPFLDGFTGPGSGLLSGSLGFSALGLALQDICKSMD